MADRPVPTIDLGTYGDARVVAAVHVTARRSAYRDLVPASILTMDTVERREAQWRERLSDRDGRCWLACHEGAPSGFIYTGPRRDPDLSPACSEIQALYILEEWTGRGLGRLLSAHALEDLWGRGCSEVVLWCAEENLRAMRFYQTMGFTLDPRIGGAPLGDTGLTRRRLRMARP